MEQAPRSLAGIIVLAAAWLAVLLSYFAFLAANFATLRGVGDAAVGNAYAVLTALAALWSLLLILLVVDQVRAKGRWARPAILLVPIAALATIFATDYPGNRLCVWAVVALPLIVIAYLMLGWMPRAAASLAGRGQVLMLLPMAALSIYPIEKFIS